MTAAPLVSIIVPVYNAALYVAETLDSVLAQTYQNLEILVLDDGSRDETPSVLERYRGHDRVRLLRHDNRGEAATVLRGAGEATGEFLAIVNADDPVEPELIARAVAVLSADPSLGAVYPDWRRIDPKGAPIGDVQTVAFDLPLMLSANMCIPGVGAVMRRSAVGAEPLRDGRAGACADFDFWLRFGLRNRAARIPSTLASWRFHAAGMSQAAAGAAFAADKIAMIERFFARDDLPPDIRALRNQALSAVYFKAAMVGLRAKGVPVRRYLFRSFVLQPIWPRTTPWSERRAASHVAYLSALPISRWLLQALMPALPSAQRSKAQALLAPP